MLSKLSNAILQNKNVSAANTFLSIDTRERAFLLVLEQHQINHKIEQLTIGDFAIIINNNPNIIIERKTYNDLAASIKDGRFREQRFRLLKSNCRIIYIFEGHCIGKFINGISVEILKSAILNLVVRDGICVQYSTDINETYNLIIDIFCKAIKYYSPVVILSEETSMNNIDQCDDIHYCEVLKTQKKKNITHRGCLINQLAEIPSVSKNMASAIVIVFDLNNIKDLLDLINNCDTEYEKEMFFANSNIYFGSNRRIGKGISKRIYEFLCYGERDQKQNQTSS